MIHNGTQARASRYESKEESTNYTNFHELSEMYGTNSCKFVDTVF